MSWDDVCKTKGEGGLGIKKLEDITKSTAIKLLWRFIQGESLWAKWIQNKNCNNINFWTALMNNNTSYTWRLLLKARQWCKGLIDRKIAIGENRMYGLIHGLREDLR